MFERLTSGDAYDGLTAAYVEEFKLRLSKLRSDAIVGVALATAYPSEEEFIAALTDDRMSTMLGDLARALVDTADALEETTDDDELYAQLQARFPTTLDAVEPLAESLDINAVDLVNAITRD